MHRSLAKTLAALAGAAALIVAPLFVFLAPAQSQEIPYGNEANVASFWVDWLEDQGYTNVQCTKDDSPVADPYPVPDDKDYLLIVIKGGSGPGSNELFWNPDADDELSHSSAGNSHVILCTGDKPSTSTSTTTSTSTKTTSTSTKTTSTHTGPVVETDRPSDGGAANVALVAGVATVLAGAGALVLSRRRQGDHR